MDNSNTFYQHLAQTSPHPIGLEILEAKGAYLYGKDGKAYLDFTAGIAVNNMGHGHPEIVKAVQDQAARYMHVMPYGEYVFDVQTELAQKLTSLLPKSLDSIYLVNSGTEANEAAMKLTKRITGRPHLIGFKGSYHGNTQGSLSISGNEQKKYAFRPLLPGVRFIEFNALNDLVKIDETTAGVFVEPVQGDAGVRLPKPGYLKALKARCEEVGALLVFDEIQTGMGRTGSLFAFQKFGVEPDILTIGKAFGGGLPLAGMVSSKSNTHAFTQNPMLGHITTFGGNPVACASALAHLNLVSAPPLLKEVGEKAEVLASYLNHPKVVEVRNAGLMFAVEMKNPDQVQYMVETCRDKGLLIFWFLSAPHCFRIQPPLNLRIEDIHKGGEIIREALDQLS